MERNAGVDWEAVDDVIYGCANQAGEDNRNVARMALLLAGLPKRVPGATINRLCGSGMDAIDRRRARHQGRRGRADRSPAASKSMSRAPFVMPKADTAFSRNAEIYDTTIGWRFVNPLMKKQYGVDSMPETGENVAEDFQYRREDQDALRRAAARRRPSPLRPMAGWPKRSSPVTIPQRKGDPIVVDKDEHPRAGTTMEVLGEAADAVPRGRHGDGRQCVGRQRRRGGADRRLGGGGAEIRPDADRPHPRRRRRRRGAAHHGHRPGAGNARSCARGSA